jgi:hypothetical protein
VNAGASGTAAVGNTPGAQVAGPTGPGAQVGAGNVGLGNFQPFGQTPWYSNTAFRQQLQLNQNQLNQLNQNYSNAYNQFQTGVSQLRGLPPAQAQQQYAELYRNFRANLNQNAGSIINDPQQLARYNQMLTQYQSFDAFSDPIVQERLNLTDQQLQQLNRYRQEWATQLQQFRNIPPAQQQAAVQRFNQMQNQFNQRVSQVLTTPQQQQIWAELYGQPIAFNYDAYFGADAAANQGTPTSGPTDPGSRSVGTNATAGGGSTTSGTSTGSTNNTRATGTGSVGTGTTSRP